MLRNAGIVSAAVIAAMSWGCGGKQKAKPSAEVQAGPYAPSQPALQATSAAEMLPPEVLLVVAAGSPSRLAEQLGWSALLTKHAPLVEASAEIKAELGHNLLDPATWTEVGVDPTRPVGLALVGDEDRVIIFAGLSDEARLLGMVERVGGKAIVKETVGDATLVTFAGNDNAGLVFRGGQVLLCGGDDAVANARAAASRAPADSLAQHGRYTAAMAGLGFGRDLAVYFDPQAAIAAELGVQTSRIFEGMSLGLELGGSTIRIKGFMPVPAGSPMEGMLRGSSGVPAIVRATAEAPVMLYALSFDPQRALSLLEQFADPRDMAQMRDGIKQFFNIDLDADIIGQLTGEIGFVWTGADVSLEDGDAMVQKFGMGFTLGLKDGAQFATVIDRVLANPMLSGFVTRADDGSMSVPIPGWKTLHLKIVGNTFAAATDPAFFARLGGDGGESYAARVANDDLRQLLAMDGPAALFSMDMVVTGWLLAAGRSSDYPMESSAVASPSEAWTKKKAELDEVERQLATIEDRQSALMERGFALARRAGTTAIHYQVADGGWVMYGGQFMTGGTLAELIDGAATLWAEGDALSEEERSLDDRRWQLRDELQELGGGAEVAQPPQP